MENKKQNTELADILLRHKGEFFKKHRLCPEQAKAYESIINCRTLELGGHAHRCDHCGFTRQAYNSCRNRHCPKCQFVKQVQWVDRLKANLPPVRYFHLVFTIPSCLHKTFYINQSPAYSLMFKAAGEALRICAANPKFIGARTCYPIPGSLYPQGGHFQQQAHFAMRVLQNQVFRDYGTMQYTYKAGTMF